MSTEDLTINLEQEEEVIIAVCAGEIDVAGADKLNKTVGPNIRSRNKKVVIDFNDVTFINSRGIGLLMEFSRQTKLGTGKLVLCNVSDQIAGSLNQLGIPSIIRTFSTREDAVSAIQKKGLSVTTEDTDVAMIIRATGAIDAFSVDNFEKVITKLLEENTLPAAVLDCSRIMYMNSRAIGSLMSYRKQSERLGKKFALCAIDMRIVKVIQQLGIDGVLSIYPTQAEALQAFAS